MLIRFEIVDRTTTPREFEYREPRLIIEEDYTPNGDETPYEFAEEMVRGGCKAFSRGIEDYKADLELEIEEAKPPDPEPPDDLDDFSDDPFSNEPSGLADPPDQPAPTERMASEKQAKMIFAILMGQFNDKKKAGDWLQKNYGQTYANKLTAKQAKECIDRIKQ